tara:strand:- start:471 stop:1460 length:990 start_codon:yes stop_codon:yes gene_type:complete
MGDFLKNLSADQKGALVTQALKLAPAVISFGQAKKAKDQQREYLDNITKLEKTRQEVTNPYANLSNPYANLGVATKAAEMQAEQADMALANTLDNLRQTGAGGATALAQAALKSKQGVSASIEKQEAANQKLAAQGQMQVDRAVARGEAIRFRNQERRDEIQLDRMQGLADLEGQRRAEAFGTGIQSLTSAIGGAANALINPKAATTMGSQIKTAENVTSGVDIDKIDPTGPLTDDQRQKMIENIDVNVEIDPMDEDQPVIETFSDQEFMRAMAPPSAQMPDLVLPDEANDPSLVPPNVNPFSDPFSQMQGYDLGQATVDPSTGLKITD